MKTRIIRTSSALSIALIALFIMPAIATAPRSSYYTQGGTPRAGPTSDPMTFNVTLHGRGASFPAPLINVWATQYHAANPNVAISYGSVGSGAGQRALFNKTDDFFASDAPLQPNQRPLAPMVLHIPETIGSVTVSYNLPGAPQGLNMTGAIIANIYLGAITNWNDPAITGINPGFIFPNHSITTVHRADSSGTTFVFTSFLSLDSGPWASTIGSGTVVNWPGSPTGSPPPIALTGNGNGGVASVIAATQYSLGYVELNYALQHSFTFAAVQNPQNNFILPSLQTTTFAVENSTTILPTGKDDWSGVSMLNRPGTQTYPIASFTYILIPRELNVLPRMDFNETFQANALINFLYWMVNAGQVYAPPQSYVSLPNFVRVIDNASIASITFTTPAKLSSTINLSESAAGGWNGANPGPAINIFSGDTINLVLTSSDGAQHQWFVDYNNNGVLDPAEAATASVVFSSTSATNNPPIIPAIGINVPAAGSYTYRDANNPSNTGTITIQAQLTPVVLPDPATLTQSNVQKVDTSKVTSAGTVIIDNRRLTISGNITEVAVDATSGAITAIKATLLPNLQLHTVPGSPGVQTRFLLNAQVSPNPESTIIQIQLVGTTSSVTELLTREVDMAANGFVSIVDIGIVFGDYGFSVGSPSYNPQADIGAFDTVNIQDVSIIELNFGAPVFR
jgi:phosphate transport system substrate-binding protein